MFYEDLWSCYLPVVLYCGDLMKVMVLDTMLPSKKDCKKPLNWKSNERCDEYNLYFQISPS